MLIKNMRAESKKVEPPENKREEVSSRVEAHYYHSL